MPVNVNLHSCFSIELFFLCQNNKANSCHLNQVLESTSYTGTLVWKIRDYDRRRREAISGKTLSLYSQPFYTSRYGYKMCARVYLNGDGMGKCKVVFLEF